MAANLTSVDAALKETWTESRLAEQLYQDNPLLSRVKRLKSTQVGQQAVTPIHTGRNWGYTALPAAGGNLNAAGQQGLAQATWQYTHHHQQVAIQGSAIDGTRGDALSVAEVVDMEVTGALNDLNRVLSRQVALDGSAKVTACTVNTSQTTLGLNAADGYDAIVRGWLGVGSVVDIGSSSNEGSVATDRTITGVSESATTPTITISGTAVTTATTDFVSLANSRSGATSYEMNGLRNVVSQTADLGGLSVSSNPVWQAALVDSTSQALTLDLMYAMDQRVFQKTGKEPDTIVTSAKQARAYYKALQAQVRFAGDAGLESGGVDKAKSDGRQIIRMVDIKDSDMFFLTIDDLLIVSAGDPYWVNKVEGGGGILRWIQGTDSFGSKLTVRHNFGARRRNSHGAYTGLS